MFLLMRRRGFTLIELLVVISIIALLVAILVPSLGRAKEMGRRTACQAKLHAQGQGWHMYFSQSQGRIPPLQKANQEYLGVFNYAAYFYGWWNSGVLFQQRMISSDAFWCPSFVTNIRREKYYRDSLTLSNPEPGLLLPLPPASPYITRMTYNTRRCKYYSDQSWSAVGPTSDPRKIMLRNNTTDSLGQPLSQFSFITDMNDCPSETKLSHPPGVNVLWMDSHVSYFRDSTPGGTILYDNGVDEAWASPTLHWSYDQIYVNIDKSTGWVPSP